MKKQFLSLTIALATTISLFFACSQDANPPNGHLQTDADRLLASPEYQLFSTEIHQFFNKIDQALTSLSPEKQKRKDEICATILTCKDRKKFCALAEELVTILDIDYDQHIQKINKLSENLFKGQKFTVEELTKAVQKRTFLQSSVLSTKADSDTPTTTTLLEAYLQGCSQAQETAAMLCQKNHQHTTPEEIRGCELERLALVVVCHEKCQTLYTTKPVEPDTTKPAKPAEPAEPVKPIEPTEPDPTKPTNNL